MPNKTEILTTLDAIASKRLFTNRKWLVDNETVSALFRTLEVLGLTEMLPNGYEMRCTTVGYDLDIDLQMIFMGLWEPFDAIMILQDRNLIAEDEAEDLFDLLEKDEWRYEPLLRARVQEAYWDYHKMMRVC